RIHATHYGRPAQTGVVRGPPNVWLLILKPPDFPRLREVGFQPSTSDLLFFDNIQGISHAISSLETCGPEYRRSYKQQQPEVQYMFRILATFALICAFLQVAPLANAATDEEQNSDHPVNAVIELNRT